MLPDRSRMPDGLMRFLYHARYFTLVGFVVIVIICGYWASKFTTDCSQDSAPPPGSPAAVAAGVFSEYFYGMNAVTGFIVYIKSTVPTQPHPLTVPPQAPKLIDMAMDERFNHFDFHLEYWCKTGKQIDQKYIDTHPGDSFYSLAGYNITTDASSYSSYRAVMFANLTLLAGRQYISPGNNSVSITITYNKLYKEAATSEWAKELEDNVGQILEIHGLTDFVEPYVISLPTFLGETSNSILGDLYRMFTLIIPITLVIFGVSLSSGKLILLPISVLIVALFIAAAIMDAAAQVIEVNSMSPGVMMMVLIAFTLDYTYFIASQWKREMVHLIETGTCSADEVDLLELMKSLYVTAGKTIFISCHTIVLCSVGITFFNVDLIRSLGLTIIVTAEVTGIVALLLPVALLVSFPNFFFATLEKWCNAIQPEDCVSPAKAIAMANEAEGRNSTYGLAPTPKNEKEKLLLGTHAGYGGNDDQEASQPTKAQGRSVVIAVQDGGDKPHATCTKRNSSRHSKRNSMVDATRRVSEMLLKRETAKAQSKEHSRWALMFRIAEFVTGYPQRIVFVIFAVAILATTLPFAVSPEYSNSIYQYVPRTSKILPGWKGLQSDFRAGSLFTYTLIVDYTGQNDLNVVYPKLQHITWSMINELPDTHARNIDGSAFSGVMASALPSGGNITYLDAGNCYVEVAFFNKYTPLCTYILLTSSIFLPSVTNAPYTYMLIALDWDPTEGIGHQWYTQALDLLERLEAETGFRLLLKGYPAETFDTIDYSKSAFTIIIIITVVVLFCCIFLAFGSVVIAFVVLSSVTLTVISAFGMLTYVYQYGGLDWLGWSAVQGSGAIAWQMPYMSFLASAAIALNYEIIYVTKVFELRWKGFDTRTSIILAMTATMREVSVGAVMMVTTFFGLFLSECTAMNQLGFVFAATAVSEAFIVRLFFTPPLMALLGHYNWFPLQYCPAMFTPPLVGALDAGVAIDDAAQATGDLSGVETFVTTDGVTQAKRESYVSQGARRRTQDQHVTPAGARLSHLGHRPQFTKEEDEAARDVISKYRRSVVVHQSGQDEESMMFTPTSGDATQTAGTNERTSYSGRQSVRQSTRDSFLENIARQ